MNTVMEERLPLNSPCSEFLGGFLANLLKLLGKFKACKH